MDEVTNDLALRGHNLRNACLDDLEVMKQIQGMHIVKELIYNKRLGRLKRRHTKR